MVGDSDGTDMVFVEKPQSMGGDQVVLVAPELQIQVSEEVKSLEDTVLIGQKIRMARKSVTNESKIERTRKTLQQSIDKGTILGPF